LQAINLNNDIDRRRQEKESKSEQPVSRQKMAAAKIQKIKCPSKRLKGILNTKYNATVK